MPFEEILNRYILRIQTLTESFRILMINMIDMMMENLKDSPR